MLVACNYVHIYLEYIYRLDFRNKVGMPDMTGNPDLENWLKNLMAAFEDEIVPEIKEKYGATVQFVRDIFRVIVKKKDAIVSLVSTWWCF